MIITISRQYRGRRRRGGDAGSPSGCGGGWWTTSSSSGWRRARGSRPTRWPSGRSGRPNFIERLAWALASASAELTLADRCDDGRDLSEPLMVRVTESVVAEIAREGRVVLVGRGAAAVLAAAGADAARAGGGAGADPGRADRRAARHARWRRREKLLHETDARRARYHKEYYGRDWADPVNYHMVINTGYLGLEGTADIDRAGGGEEGVGVQADDVNE